MKKIHAKTLKLHTIYNLTICTLFGGIIITNHDIVLITSVIFLLAYITGNGIIHSRKNELSRDTLVEYIIVAIIVLIVLVDSFIR